MNKLFLLALLCLTLLSCSPGTRNKLLGTWQHRADVATVTITFLADNTFQGTAAENPQTVWTFGGQWSLRGQELLYHYTASSSPNVPVGTDDKDIVIHIDDHQLTIEATSGQRRTYLRIPDPATASHP